MTFEGIAHDLKTPLTCMLGATRLIAAENLSDAGRRRLAVLEEQVERMGLLIDSYLLVGTSPPATPGVDVMDIVRRVLDEFEPLMATGGLDAGLVVGGDVPPCHCAPSTLHRVATNLLRNAIDATPPGGQITCHIHRGTENVVLVELIDTGVGMPPQMLARIFDRGFTTKQGRSHHGLGLAICKELLRCEGADIAVTSQLGIGTRVTIALPAISAGMPGGSVAP